MRSWQLVDSGGRGEWGLGLKSTKVWREVQRWLHKRKRTKLIWGKQNGNKGVVAELLSSTYLRWVAKCGGEKKARISQIQDTRVKFNTQMVMTTKWHRRQGDFYWTIRLNWLLLKGENCKIDTHVWWLFSQLTEGPDQTSALSLSLLWLCGTLRRLLCYAASSKLDPPLRRLARQWLEIDGWGSGSFPRWS